MRMCVCDECLFVRDEFVRPYFMRIIMYTTHNSLDECYVFVFVCVCTLLYCTVYCIVFACLLACLIIE